MLNHHYKGTIRGPLQPSLGPKNVFAKPTPSQLKNAPWLYREYRDNPEKSYNLC